MQCGRLTGEIVGDFGRSGATSAARMEPARALFVGASDATSIGLAFTVLLALRDTTTSFVFSGIGHKNLVGFGSATVFPFASSGHLFRDLASVRTTAIKGPMLLAVTNRHTVSSVEYARTGNFAFDSGAADNHALENVNTATLGDGDSPQAPAAYDVLQGSGAAPRVLVAVPRMNGMGFEVGVTAAGSSQYTRNADVLDANTTPQNLVLAGGLISTPATLRALAHDRGNGRWDYVDGATATQVTLPPVVPRPGADEPYRPLLLVPAVVRSLAFVVSEDGCTPGQARARVFHVRSAGASEIPGASTPCIQAGQGYLQASVPPALDASASGVVSWSTVAGIVAWSVDIAAATGATVVGAPFVRLDASYAQPSGAGLTAAGPVVCAVRTSSVAGKFDRVRCERLEEVAP